MTSLHTDLLRNAQKAVARGAARKDATHLKLTQQQLQQQPQLAPGASSLSAVPQFVAMTGVLSGEALAGKRRGRKEGGQDGRNEGEQEGEGQGSNRVRKRGGRRKRGRGGGGERISGKSVEVAKHSEISTLTHSLNGNNDMLT
jgi:hypothetical protein